MPGECAGFLTLVPCLHRGTTLATLLHRKYPLYSCPHPEFSTAGELQSDGDGAVNQPPAILVAHVGPLRLAPRSDEASKTDLSRHCTGRVHGQARRNRFRGR